MRARTCLAIALPFILATGTVVAGEVGSDYAAVLQADGRFLIDRWKLHNAIRSNPADWAAYRALVGDVSAHVHHARPQVFADFRDGSRRIEVPAAPQFDYTDAFTWSLWLRLEAAQMARETKIVSHAGVETGKVTIMGDHRRIVVLVRYEDGAGLHVRTIHEIPFAAWVHVVVSGDNRAGVKVYIDGVESPLRVLRGDPAQRARVLSVPAQTVYIGGLDRTFPGRLDDVRLYRRALSPDEIRGLSRGGSVGEDLVGHWPLDDAAGNTARDATVYGAHGVIGSHLTVGLPGRLGSAIGLARNPDEWTRELDAREAELSALTGRVKPRVESEDWERAGADQLQSFLRERGVPLVHLVEDETGEGVTAWLVGIGVDEPVTALRVPLSPAWHRARCVLVEELHARHDRPGDDARVRAAARAVASELWDPLEAVVGPGGEVWLRLPPLLADVPFSALVDRNGRYLVERYAFAHCGPVRALMRRDPRPWKPDGVHYVAIANPCAFTIDRESTSARPDIDAGGRYRSSDACAIEGQPLDGARREADAIGALIGRTRASSFEIYDWGDAQEASVDTVVVGADIVHVATHGYIVAADCLPLVPRDPLCLAGVVLAGAMRMVPEGSRGSNEGLLSAAEAALLDLSAAHLVFWSGCATATGAPLPGESLGGLSAAGWLAGARATVATLWRVSDETMPGQVEAFYRALLDGSSAARAAQAALRTGMDSARARYGHAHPARWAAMVVEGL